MTTLDLSSLQALAERATPGPWEQRCIHHMDNHASACGVWSEMGWVATTDALPRSHSEPNAAFIAAFNPAVALALLARLKRAEEALEHEIEICETPNDQNCAHCIRIQNALNGIPKAALAEQGSKP